MNSPSVKSKQIPIVLIRGGGDLASGVALRIHRVGIRLVITELAQPLAVRRLVSFSEAVTQGEVHIEGISARRARDFEEAAKILLTGTIPVLVDPETTIRNAPRFSILAIVDARMTKRPPDLGMDAAPLVIGLGPGFVAGENCHAVIETHRGHDLGRVLWVGMAEPDTGIPGKVGDQQYDRVLRAPASGLLLETLEIGSRVNTGSQIATVGGTSIMAPFEGVLRGILPEGMHVVAGMKVGDLDPRKKVRMAVTVSEKSLAIGGGVLEALLSRPEIRERLWS